jgi:hypothetical protein
MAARNERKLRALEALADGKWHRIPEWAEAAGIFSPAPGPAYKQTRGAYIYAVKLERMFLVERGRGTASPRKPSQIGTPPLLWIRITETGRLRLAWLRGREREGLPLHNKRRRPSYSEVPLEDPMEAIRDLER